MERKAVGNFVDFNELICELAYGRRMTYANMIDYEHENDCAPEGVKEREEDRSLPMVAVGEYVRGGVNTYAGGVTWVDADYDERTDEALRSSAYCDARDFIFSNAQAGSVCIFARRRKSGSATIPARYFPIPKEEFIAEHIFAPDDPPSLWPKDGSTSRDAIWFFPKVTSKDASTLVSLWPSRTIAIAPVALKEARAQTPIHGGTSQSKVNRALETVSARFEAENRRPKAGELLTAVREIEPNASREQLRAARHAGHVPEAWRKTGAPKKLRKN